MPKDWAYLRESRSGTSIDAQFDALRAAGLTVQSDGPSVFVDRLPASNALGAVGTRPLSARTALVAALEPGGRVWVAGLDRLGVSGNDLRYALDRVIRRKCSVYDCALDALYDEATEASVLDAAVLVVTAALNSERIRKAAAQRSRRAADGDKAATGGNPGWRPTPAEEEAARLDWLNPTLTQEKVAKRHGVASITLRRRFGSRGLPRGRKKAQSQ